MLRPPPTRRTAADEIDRMLTATRELVEPELRRAVRALPEPFRLMAGYQFGWCDASGRADAAPTGKMLRPALLLAAFSAYHDDTARALPAAAAVELLHNFSLIHDDVMDGDALRRGRETIWRRWGSTNAILLGDALHALATRTLCRCAPESVTAALALLDRAAIDLCVGQYLDCAFESRPAVGGPEYLRMAEAKTGALLGCACALGALCAGTDRSEVTAMDTRGRELGIAFQLIDDLMGLWGDPAVTGKPVGHDLARRKRSFPVVAAIESGDPAGARLAQRYESPEPWTAAEIAAATALVERAGGRERTEATANARIDAALATLPDTPAFAGFRALALFVAHRDR
ncbi:polyprenyl synthetase family protein [Nocardia sp. NPDC003482]